MKISKVDNFKSYDFMGAHLVNIDDKQGVGFTVWAPNAKEVYLVGDFNNWNKTSHPMKKTNYGNWYLFIENINEGSAYKYRVVGKDGITRMKSDPYGFFSEKIPNNASIVYNIGGYKWNDDKCMKSREKDNIYEKPINIYEVHLGSWKRKWDGEFLK
ncbi:MAG TPA: 1,4-alpha-glucan branching enzyme, partial [Peptostreptococcaceae bacterium]|nr:1,4-alpha-glucan branching enzyme [Peptostreptococcaceae bacterium]